MVLSACLLTTTTQHNHHHHPPLLKERRGWGRWLSGRRLNPNLWGWVWGVVYTSPAVWPSTPPHGKTKHRTRNPRNARDASLYAHPAGLPAKGQPEHHAPAESADYDFSRVPPHLPTKDI